MSDRPFYAPSRVNRGLASISGLSGRMFASSIVSSAMMARGAWRCRFIESGNFYTAGAGRPTRLALDEADERKAQLSASSKRALRRWTMPRGTARPGSSWTGGLPGKPRLATFSSGSSSTRSITVGSFRATCGRWAPTIRGCERGSPIIEVPRCDVGLVRRQPDDGSGYRREPFGADASGGPKTTAARSFTLLRRRASRPLSRRAR
jgi:hypothetical protein